jgi:hypothetical protein
MPPRKRIPRPLICSLLIVVSIHVVSLECANLALWRGGRWHCLNEGAFALDAVDSMALAGSTLFVAGIAGAARGDDLTATQGTALDFTEKMLTMALCKGGRHGGLGHPWPMPIRRVLLVTMGVCRGELDMGPAGASGGPAARSLHRGASRCDHHTRPAPEVQKRGKTSHSEV